MRRRPQRVAATGCPRTSGDPVRVAAERQRGQRVRSLPRRAERDGPCVGVVDAERLVGRLEAAATEAAQDLVCAGAQRREVGVTIAVDVEGIGAGDPSRSVTGDASWVKTKAPPVGLSLW